MWLGNVTDSKDLQLLRQGEVVVYAETVSSAQGAAGGRPGCQSPAPKVENLTIMQWALIKRWQSLEQPQMLTSHRRGDKRGSWVIP